MSRLKDEIDEALQKELIQFRNNIQSKANGVLGDGGKPIYLYGFRDGSIKGMDSYLDARLAYRQEDATKPVNLSIMLSDSRRIGEMEFWFHQQTIGGQVTLRDFIRQVKTYVDGLRHNMAQIAPLGWEMSAWGEYQRTFYNTPERKISLVMYEDRAFCETGVQWKRKTLLKYHSDIRDFRTSWVCDITNMDGLGWTVYENIIEVERILSQGRFLRDNVFELVGMDREQGIACLAMTRNSTLNDLIIKG